MLAAMVLVAVVDTGSLSGALPSATARRTR